MPRMNLMKMSVAALVALRDEVQAALSTRIAAERTELQEMIDTLGRLETLPGPDAAIRRPQRRRRAAASGSAEEAPSKRRTASRAPTTKVVKVAPKYRGPNGETWTGRGNAPRWLSALEAEGKTRESYLIKK